MDSARKEDLRIKSRPEGGRILGMYATARRGANVRPYQTMLLGVVALRAGAGKKILYDAQNMRITNDPEANQYLTREYRPGWAI